MCSVISDTRKEECVEIFYYAVDQQLRPVLLKLLGNDWLYRMICKAVEVNRDHGWYNVGTGIPVTLQSIETIIKAFSPADHPSQIIYRPDKPAGGDFLMAISNAKEELGYEPKYDVEALFRNYKEEMEVNRFKELRGE